MKRNIYLMYAIAFLQGMVFYGPIATLYRQARGVSVFQITLIESISLLLCILLEIPWGVAAEKIGYRSTMIFCCVLYFLSKLVFWQADRFLLFLLERVMLSVVIAGLSGVDASVLYLSCKGNDSQKIFGIYNSLQMAGLLTATAIFSLFVRDRYGLAALLTVISYGLAALLSVGLQAVQPEKTARITAGQFREILRQTLCDKQLLLFLLLTVFLSETHQTITVFFSQLQYEKCGLSHAAIGFLYLIATLLGALGVFSSALTKKIGIRAIGFICSGAAAVSCLVLAFSGRALPSVCGILLICISNSLFQPFRMEMQNRRLHTEYRAAALSVHSMITDSIGAGMNLVFGSLAEQALPLAFLFGAAVCTAATVLFSFWAKRPWSN